MSLIFSTRFQSQVTDANLGTKGLNALMGVLDPIRVTSIEAALIGDGSGAACILGIDITVVGVGSAPVRAQLASMVAWARNAVRSSKAARLLPATMFGIPTIDLLAAVFLYTAENPYPLYSCITVPLNVSGVRTLQSLLQQLPFMKLFTLGLRCLPRGPTYRFKGALYRGIDISRSAAFKAKYDSHATSYQVGTTITFVAPTSFSTSDQAAGAFTKGIQFVVPDGEGVNLDDLSAFDEENEVVVDGPSSWEVVASTMTPTGTLVIVLKRLPDFVTFLTHVDVAAAVATPAAATAAFSALSSALVVSSDAGIDPELEALSDSLFGLKVGVKKACAAFAVALGQQGVMCIEDLGFLSQPKARDILVRVGLSELQQMKVMQAIAPVPAAAKATPSFSLAGIFRPPGSSDLQALKKSGFTARQLRVAGCDIAILRECGYHVLNLLDAGFRPDEITAAGLDVMGVQANHTRCSLFHAGFEMTEMLTSHLRTSFLVGRLHVHARTLKILLMHLVNARTLHCLETAVFFVAPRHLLILFLSVKVTFFTRRCMHTKSTNGKWFLMATNLSVFRLVGRLLPWMTPTFQKCVRSSRGRHSAWCLMGVVFIQKEWDLMTRDLPQVAARSRILHPLPGDVRMQAQKWINNFF
jgi:hypothetical protein